MISSETGVITLFHISRDTCLPHFVEFTFIRYAGAVDSRLKQAMIDSEVLQEAAITNSALPPMDQRVSTLLHFMLVQLLEGSAQRLLDHAGDGEGFLSWRRLVAEYEPATAGRETPLLLEVFAQTFEGDVRGLLDEFEVKIRRYERTCGKNLSDRVKIAVVQTPLAHACCSPFDVSLRTRRDTKHHDGPRHTDRSGTDGRQRCLGDQRFKR